MNKINVIGITFYALLIISCTSTTKNKTSIVDKPKVNQVVVDTKTKSKIASLVNENEVIDGWLMNETKQQIVVNKLGMPESKDEEVYLGSTGTYAQTWEYSSLGISLVMESENQGGDKNVRSITIVQPCKLSTSQGISIGSDTKIVKEKYLKLIDASNSDANSIVVGSIYGGTIFTLKDGVVSKIFIGAAAE